MSKEYLTVDNKLIMVDGKLVEVPANTELSDVLDAQESEITTRQNEGDKLVDEIVGYVDGSPRGVYASLSALQSAFPSGAQGVYVTTDNGHWYYWSGTAWTDGGVYQAKEIADGSIYGRHINNSVKTKNKFDFSLVQTKKQISSNGSIANYDNGFVIDDKIAITSGETLYLWIKDNNIPNLEFRLFFAYYDNSGNFITKKLANDPYSFPTTWMQVSINGAYYRVKPYTVPSNASYMKIQGDMNKIQYNQNVLICSSNEFDAVFSYRYEILGGLNDYGKNNLKFNYKEQSADYQLSGECKENESNFLGLITAGFNSIQTTEIANQYRSKVYPKFSHDSTLVIDNNGTAYCVYVANDVSLGDSPSNNDAKVCLSIYNNIENLSASSTFNTIEIAKINDLVNGEQINSGCGVPNLILKGNELYIYFSARLNNTWYLLYRIYNISNNQLSVIYKVELLLNGNYVEYTNENIANIIGESPSVLNSFISMNASIAYDGSYYYAGVCIGSLINSSLIFRSLDCIKWELYITPNIGENIDAVFENSLCYYGGYLYSCIRRTPEHKNLLLLRYNGTNLQEKTFINGASCRPMLFTYNNELFLIYNLSDRFMTNIMKVSKTHIDTSCVINQVGINSVYPTVAEYNGKLYFLSTGASSTAVYIRRLKLYTYTIKEVAGILSRFLEFYSKEQ